MRPVLGLGLGLGPESDAAGRTAAPRHRNPAYRAPAHRRRQGGGANTRPLRPARPGRRAATPKTAARRDFAAVRRLPWTHRPPAPVPSPPNRRRRPGAEGRRRTNHRPADRQRQRPGPQHFPPRAIRRRARGLAPSAALPPGAGPALWRERARGWRSSARAGPVRAGSGRCAAARVAARLPAGRPAVRQEPAAVNHCRTAPAPRGCGRRRRGAGENRSIGRAWAPGWVRVPAARRAERRRQRPPPPWRAQARRATILLSNPCPALRASLSNRDPEYQKILALAA